MAPSRDQLAPYGAFGLAALIWGSTFLAIRLGNRTVDPLWAATLRLVLASAILFAIVIALDRPIPRGRGFVATVGYGVLGFGGTFALLYWGETLVPSGITAVLFATIPLWSSLFGALMGVEELDARRLVGATVALVGVAAIFAGELDRAVPLEGLLAVLASAMLAALSSVLLKRGGKPPVIALNAYGTGMGAVVTLVGSVLIGESHAWPTTFEAWWPILYLTIAGSLIAFLAFTWLVGVWPVSNANMISVLVPLIGLVLGAVFAGERPSPIALAGAASVVGSVAWVLRRAPTVGGPGPEAPEA